MTKSSHEQSLAAEDEGGGIDATSMPLEDDTNKNLDNPADEEDPEETEDEEVKVNCVGGFAGVEESDMSSDEDNSDHEDEDNLSDPEDEEESEEDEESVEEDEIAKDKPVQFVSSQQTNGLNVRRPRAVLANSPDLSQRRDEELDDDDDSSMDESSDDDSSSDGAGDIGMALEDAQLDESDDEESLSDASSRYNEDPSSAGGIAGSEDESEDSDEEDQDEDLKEETAVTATAEANQPRDEEMSDDESTTSVPLDCFKNCDGPSDVTELETALQDSKYEEQDNNDDDVSTGSNDSAMEDLAQDATLQSALLCNIEELETSPTKRNLLTHEKRTLSSSALLGRASLSAPNPAMLSPKRLCRPGDVESSSSEEDFLPSLSLGLTAFGNGQKVSISDEDDEEQDRQLGEELRDGEEERERESTPIPLLTPPASPLRIDGDEGDTTICEWPSNLTVDSAMVATMDLRPPSPANLQLWEQEEEERLMKSEVSPKFVPEKGFSSSLTPMMRGISVEPEAPVFQL